MLLFKIPFPENKIRLLTGHIFPQAIKYSFILIDSYMPQLRNESYKNSIMSKKRKKFF